ncbi:hypothetical protein B0H11DRAFT_2004765 [Mycena galericulata]|nr:hypothetical protein B0H11DRAFT_2004765 [Mycena galericulata]
MEYVNALDCTKESIELVARAVQTLISVRGPSSAPGHVGGGSVVHGFFVNQSSPFKYKTVDELNQHVNGILKCKGDPRRVNLVADASDGLYLCPCFINPENFKELPGGKVVALDFHDSCFLPPSFFAVAMEMSNDGFTIRVAERVEYPTSDDVAAMKAASYFLVPFGRDDIGHPDSFHLI